MISTKQEELMNDDSVLAKAKDDELVFVLLGRDVAAPAAIREWVNERIGRGKNSPSDIQIQEALACATLMEQRRKEWPCGTGHVE